jgi:hypothetical protein
MSRRAGRTAFAFAGGIRQTIERHGAPLEDTAIPASSPAT